jgi:formylmethanofuran dehydrogenase subunit D
MTFDLTIVTYEDRDIFREEDIFSDSYIERAAMIELDEEEMKRYGVGEGENILLQNDYGEVVVKVKRSEEEGGGVGYMPRSPLSSILLSEETKVGILGYKHIKVNAKKTNDPVTDLKMLFK